MENLGGFLRVLRIILAIELKQPGALGLSFQLYNFFRSTRSLRRFKNIHDGKKCFIVGTGPSLHISDLDLLKNYYCFGVNTLFKVYDRTQWRPDYYCVIDPNTYGDIRMGLKEYGVKNIFLAQNRIRKSSILGDIIPINLECSSFYKMGMSKHLETMKFSSDISKCVFDGASVMFAALQVAVYMGFREIYLLGADCNYTPGSFHNASLGYSQGYQYDWTKQTGLTMIEGFKVADRVTKQMGVKIFNASRGGMLEVFPRVKLEDVVEKSL